MRIEARAGAALLLWLLLPFAHAGSAVEHRDPIDYFFHPFLGDLKAEAADAKKAGKAAIMVMYEFDDCPYCARMKREVLSRSDVQHYYRKHFQLFQIDTRGDQQITGFDGRNSIEKEFARAAGIRGTPTFIFYGLDDGKPLVTQTGGIYEPMEFMLLGEYVASGAYRSRSFAQYLKSKKGS
ncbi:MAG TPA: thioredoxin fold domain-containing protein [Burkholderiales bacterium]|nr:thioredoxin fold domain-containing protein [Burkholderiales bacterium]